MKQKQTKEKKKKTNKSESVIARQEKRSIPLFTVLNVG